MLDIRQLSFLKPDASFIFIQLIQKSRVMSLPGITVQNSLDLETQVLPKYYEENIICTP